MGVHQYKLYLLPRGTMAFDPDGEDEPWGDEQPSSALLSDLRALLPKDTSWGGVEEFESEMEWGSDLRIWHDDEKDGPVRSIVFRFSPIADAPVLLERFVSVATTHGLRLYSSASARALEPDIGVVLADLQSTPAFKFLSDPKGAVLQAPFVDRPKQPD